MRRVVECVIGMCLALGIGALMIGGLILNGHHVIWDVEAEKSAYNLPLFGWSSAENVGYEFVVLGLLCVGVAVLWWRALRKVHRDYPACESCGYNMTGLPGVRACPECGATTFGDE